MCCNQTARVPSGHNPHQFFNLDPSQPFAASSSFSDRRPTRSHHRRRSSASSGLAVTVDGPDRGSPQFLGVQGHGHGQPPALAPIPGTSPRLASPRLAMTCPPILCPYLYLCMHLSVSASLSASSPANHTIHIPARGTPPCFPSLCFLTTPVTDMPPTQIRVGQPNDRTRLLTSRVLSTLQAPPIPQECPSPAARLLYLEVVGPALA